MIITEHYHLHRTSFQTSLISNDIPFCPACGSAVVGYGYRTRVRRPWMIFPDELAQQVHDGDPIRIRRLYCPSCHQIHHEIPICMLRPEEKKDLSPVK